MPSSPSSDEALSRFLALKSAEADSIAAFSAGLVSAPPVVVQRAAPATFAPSALFGEPSSAPASSSPAQQAAARERGGGGRSGGRGGRSGRGDVEGDEDGEDAEDEDDLDEDEDEEDAPESLREELQRLENTVREGHDTNERIMAQNIALLADLEAAQRTVRELRAGKNALALQLRAALEREQLLEQAAVAASAVAASF
jgi:hypothetical protein